MAWLRHKLWPHFRLDRPISDETLTRSPELWQSRNPRGSLESPEARSCYSTYSSSVNLSRLHASGKQTSEQQLGLLLSASRWASYSHMARTRYVRSNILFDRACKQVHRKRESPMLYIKEHPSTVQLTWTLSHAMSVSVELPPLSGSHDPRKYLGTIFQGDFVDVGFSPNARCSLQSASASVITRCFVCVRPWTTLSEFHHRAVGLVKRNEVRPYWTVLTYFHRMCTSPRRRISKLGTFLKASGKCRATVSTSQTF